MKFKGLSRAVALALCISLLFACGLADEALLAEPVDAPVSESNEWVLTPGPEAADTRVLAAEGTSDAPTADPTAAPTAAPELARRGFSETEAIDSATFEKINLVCEAGFKGYLATVQGTLTLKDVRIAGKPARDVNLLKAFKLGPKGKIVVEDGAELTADAAALCVNKGETQKLSLTYRGAPLSGKKARWTSSNGKIVKVSKAGVVTALKKGKAVVTATYRGHAVKCRVAVTNIVHVQAVEITEENPVVSLNRTAALKARFTPAKPTDRNLTWKSSDESVATVDESGVVTGVAVGTATITVTTADGGKADTCQVTVKEVKPTSLNMEHRFITMELGATMKTPARVLPENNSYPGLAYASSDPSVAAVDRSTGVIEAKKCGVATITATSTWYPKAVKSCKLYVLEPGSGPMAGLIIGINPGHQKTGINKQYPMAPGSSKTGRGVGVGAGGHWTHVAEYETNLQVGLKLAKRLEDLGATVVMTRTTNDVMLTNIERAKMLNDAGVDIALQLHCDAVDNSSFHGCATYYRDNSDWVAESRDMAKLLAKGISYDTGCVNRGAKVYNNYMSLNWSTTPAVLIEMGFISNEKEDRLLASDDYRGKVADGIVRALRVYFER